MCVCGRLILAPAADTFVSLAVKVIDAIDSAPP